MFKDLSRENKPFEPRSLTLVNYIPYTKYFCYFSASTTEALSSLQVALELKSLGKIDKAMKLLEHALALAPKHPDILNHYGEMLEEVNEDIIKADQMYFQVKVKNIFITI